MLTCYIGTCVDKVKGNGSVSDNREGENTARTCKYASLFISIHIHALVPRVSDKWPGTHL